MIVAVAVVSFSLSSKESRPRPRGAQASANITSSPILLLPYNGTRKNCAGLAYNVVFVNYTSILLLYNVILPRAADGLPFEVFLDSEIGVLHSRET